MSCSKLLTEAEVGEANSQSVLHSAKLLIDLHIVSEDWPHSAGFLPSVEGPFWSVGLAVGVMDLTVLMRGAGVAGDFGSLRASVAVLMTGVN